ncbi:MAG: hypothetical protein HS111_05795 [Kofleriaceae bacterium]|nr:hypothetical protein [Kofleriaceae bacterium]
MGEDRRHPHQADQRRQLAEPAPALVEGGRQIGSRGQPAARRPRPLEPGAVDLALGHHLEVREEPVAGDGPVQRDLAIGPPGVDLDVAEAADLDHRPRPAAARELARHALGIGERHRQARPQPLRPHRDPALEIDAHGRVIVGGQEVEAELLPRGAAELGGVDVGQHAQAVERPAQEREGVLAAAGGDDIGGVGRDPAQAGVVGDRGRQGAAAGGRGRARTAGQGQRDRGQGGDGRGAPARGVAQPRQIVGGGSHADMMHGRGVFFTQRLRRPLDTPRHLTRRAPCPSLEFPHGSQYRSQVST